MTLYMHKDCVEIFADDVLLFGNSPEDLQHSLNILTSYCATWNLTVNLSKTKVMVFHARNLSHLTFCYLCSPIEIKSEYKYLSIVFTSNGLFSKASLSLAGQANKTLFSLLKKAQSLNFPNSNVMSHLFDSMVLPILEYGSELWDHKVYDAIEKVHLRFCKFLLHVPSI